MVGLPLLGSLGYPSDVIGGNLLLVGTLTLILILLFLVAAVGVALAAGEAASLVLLMGGLVAAALLSELAGRAILGGLVARLAVGGLPLMGRPFRELSSREKVFTVTMTYVVKVTYPIKGRTPGPGPHLQVLSIHLRLTLFTVLKKLRPATR